MANLITVRAQEKSRADKVLSDTRANLQTARKDAEKAKQAADDAAKKAGDLQNEGKALRAELRGADMRAEIDRLAKALEDNALKQRLASAAVADAAATLSAAQQVEADLSAAADAAQKAADAATKAHGEAEKQEELFAAWRSAMKASATEQAVALAKTYTTAEVHRRAVARLTRMLGGGDLLTLYRHRATYAAANTAVPADLLRQAIEVAAAARADVEPLTKARMETAAKLAVHIDLVQDAAEATVSSVAAAMKMLGEVAGRDAAAEGKEPLKSQLAELAKRAKQVIAAGVVAKEKTVQDEALTLANAERLEDRAELVGVDKDPDTPPDKQPATDVRKATKDAGSKVEAAEKRLKDLVDVPDPGPDLVPKDVVDGYEVAVPAELLADVVALLDAEAALNKAAALDLAQRLTDFEAAEAAYAAAEVGELRERRAVVVLDAIVEARRRRRTMSAGTAAADRLLTIRGDR